MVADAFLFFFGSELNDKVSVVLYGTKDFKNDFGLDHVHVVKGLENLTAKYIREVGEKLRGVEHMTYDGSENHRGLSLKLALWTCSHMLKEYSKKTHVEKRIFIFTDDDDPCGGDPNLSKQVLGRLADLKELQVDLQLYPLGDPAGREFSRDFWGEVLGEMCETEESFLEAMQLSQADNFEMIRRKLNRKRRWLKTQIKIGPNLKIGVDYYVTLARQLKAQRSVCAQTNCLLESSTAYVAESGEVLPKDERPLKGWTVRGKDVHATPLEYEHIRDPEVPLGFNVLGFKPESALNPAQQVKPAAFLYPTAVGGCSSNHRGFLAFHEKMLVLGQVAMCSFSSSRGSSVGTELVYLVAQQEVKDEHGGQLEPPGFHVVALPYADDVRSPEEQQRKKGELPQYAGEDQVQRAKELVAAMKLDEDWDSTYIRNPALQRHYQILQALALGEDPTQVSVEDGTLPAEAVLEGAKGAITAFAMELPPMDVPAPKKRAPAAKRGTAAKKGKV